MSGSDPHFQIDLDQAPQAIAAFRHASEQLRDLMRDAEKLANIPAPGWDAVSLNAVKEIGQWAAGNEPGSLRSALESGAIELEKVATALERSVQAHRNTDDANAGQLRSRGL